MTTVLTGAISDALQLVLSWLIKYRDSLGTFFANLVHCVYVHSQCALEAMAASKGSEHAICLSHPEFIGSVSVLIYSRWVVALVDATFRVDCFPQTAQEASVYSDIVRFGLKLSERGSDRVALLVLATSRVITDRTAVCYSDLQEYLGTFFFFFLGLFP